MATCSYWNSRFHAFPQLPSRMEAFWILHRLCVLTKWWARTCFLLKSWKEIRVTQTETSAPGYLESMSLVQIGYYSNSPARCIGSPRTRLLWGGEWTRDIWKALGRWTWGVCFFFNHCTILPSPLYRWRNWSWFLSVQWRLRNFYLGHPWKACVWEILPSCPSLAGFLFCNNSVWGSEGWPPPTPFLAYH